MPATPPDPDWPARPIRGVDRLGWDIHTNVEDVSLMLGEHERGYRDLRARLNAITGGWNYDYFRAWFSDGFDPFTTPPVPPEGEEYRYPILVRARSLSDDLSEAEEYDFGENEQDEACVQVDVAHEASGSDFEYSSKHQGPADLRAFAAKAGLELEIWEGPPALRWGR